MFITSIILWPSTQMFFFSVCRRPEERHFCASSTSNNTLIMFKKAPLNSLGSLHYIYSVLFLLGTTVTYSDTSSSVSSIHFYSSTPSYLPFLFSGF